MSAGAPPPSSKREALHAAARAVRVAQREDRDALAAAQRVLRRAHGGGEDEGVAEARRLLGRLGDVVDADEAVLDMAPAVAAGHDGVFVATDRRMIFLALRRTLSRAYSEITQVVVRGRRFRARLVVSTADAKVVIGGLSPRRAAELAGVVQEGGRRGTY